MILWLHDTGPLFVITGNVTEYWTMISQYRSLDGIMASDYYYLQHFVAPTGAQEVTIFVRYFVRPVLDCLKLSILIFWAQIYLDHTQSVLQDGFRMTQNSEHSEIVKSNQSS